MMLASTPSGVAIAAYVLASLVVVAVIAVLTLFALRQREIRIAAAGDDHPAGTALPDRLVAAARLRRREAVPPIRVADAGDEARLAEIEAQSDPGLDGSGLGVLPTSALRERDAPASVLLVAGRPAVAYIRVDEVDGNAHIDQLGVLRAVARRGIGNALIEAAVDWAVREGYRAMTLSTFAESDWNARVYGASGFVPVEATTPGLLELRDWERAIGLDAVGERVVMRRELRA